MACSFGAALILGRRKLFFSVCLCVCVCVRVGGGRGGGGGGVSKIISFMQIAIWHIWQS